MKVRIKVWNKTNYKNREYTRAPCARVIINTCIKYTWAIIIYFLSVTLKRINIFIVDASITYKHFHSKNMKRKKEITMMKKAKNPGGLLLNPLNFFLGWLWAYDYVRWIALVWIDILCFCCKWISLLKKILQRTEVEENHDFSRFRGGGSHVSSR